MISLAGCRWIALCTCPPSLPREGVLRPRAAPAIRTLPTQAQTPASMRQSKRMNARGPHPGGPHSPVRSSPDPGVHETDGNECKSARIVSPSYVIIRFYPADCRSQDSLAAGGCSSRDTHKGPHSKCCRGPHLQRSSRDATPGGRRVEKVQG